MKKKITKSAISIFKLKTTSFLPEKQYRHVYNKKVICVTDSKGYSQPDNKSLIDLRVNSSDGFIPLWDKDVTLNWRFDKSFGSFFEDEESAKDGIRNLLGQAILSWKEACPVKFREVKDNWDFEISMHTIDCDSSGCVLASAFFPNAGQNKLYIYPTMFEQSEEEQRETLEHEIGHVFGLRHFFANIRETGKPSEPFGKEIPFSIMNYGSDSKLTSTDIDDLKRLYQLVWSNELTKINGTPIKKFISYHMS
ncbi:MAG: matrixin family metalloprotease [Saprospiraceae bacterium]|uniref:Matrixin family metalloprotease n=1 Tax=Candidatus Defluviibacterium haderslevense TaxID=2981993 RepID=A0A9D7SCM8_9BACT|nr:matrixin family metalloprotease [Candidatus Defluviibacterium haderslevense]